jgi:hypothetical protein
METREEMIRFIHEHYPWLSDEEIERAVADASAVLRVHLDGLTWMRVTGALPDTCRVAVSAELE